MPKLATSYNVAMNNSLPVVDFELRKGVKFHNGDSFTAKMVKEVANTKGLKTASVSSNLNIHLLINTILPGTPFADKRVRQAMAYAIDKQAIIDKVLYGQGSPTYGAHPGVLGYDPSLKPYPYDPEKAKQLLKEAGYPMG